MNSGITNPVTFLKVVQLSEVLFARIYLGNQKPTQRENVLSEEIKSTEIAEISEPKAKPKAKRKPKTKVTTGNRLTAEDYEKAKNLRRQEGWSVNKISKEVGVTENALWRRFKADGIKKSSELHLRNQAIEEAKFQAMAQQAATMCEESTEGTRLAQQAAVFLTKANIKLFSDCVRNGTPFSAVFDDAKALGELTKNLSGNIRIARQILEDFKTEDDDTLPELVVRTMTDDDVAQLRIRQDSEKELDGYGLGLDVDEELQELDARLEPS